MKWFFKLVWIRNFISLFLRPFSRNNSDVKTEFWRKFNTFCQSRGLNPKFWHHFIINIIIGSLIAIVLHLFHHTSMVSQVENVAMDNMMFINQGIHRMRGMSENGDPLKFSFINIDEDSYRAWDEPFHIPRDKMLNLIQFSVNNGARAIIVDVDFSKGSENDTELLTYLQAYNELNPPLFLLRSFYPPSHQYTRDKDYQIRSSILDTLLAKTNILWVQPTFKQSRYDQVVRYWQLLKIGCLNNEPVVIPSFQLLLDAYLSAPDGLNEISSQLKKLTPEHCSDIELTEKSLSGQLLYGNKRINLEQKSHQRVGERIIFTLAKPVESTDELIWRPAYKFIESSNPLSASLVHNRVVIIGASFRDGRDLHQTPLGEMSGAMIILNAIKSLNTFGQIKPPSLVVKVVLESGLILLMAWAFAHFNSIKGAIVSGFVIMIVLLPISFYFFKYGLWVDFSVPLLGMQFHQLVAEYEENNAIRCQLNHKTSD